MTQPEKRILLIQTGGTIDAKPYADPKNPPPIVQTLKGSDSHIPAILKASPEYKHIDHLSWGYWVEGRLVKDSNLFTKEDILALADIIKSDSHRYFILTHGTDAMAKNAALLQKELEGSNKVVAFVGAMVPLSMRDAHKDKGDAIINLNFSAQNITTQADGVYVVGIDKATQRREFLNPEKLKKDLDASLSELALNFTR